MTTRDFGRNWGMAALLCGALVAAPAHAEAPAKTGSFTMQQVLAYPFVPEIEAARHGDAIAFVRVLKGVRNIWVADGPGFKPRQVTHYTQDDGQELTQLTFTPDGKHLVYVRGGDHDANWEAKLPPDPDSSTTEPKVTIWAASLSGGAPVKVVEGDKPALSAKGELAYVKDGQVWTAPLDGPEKSKGKAKRLFFDRGDADDLQWSPDGSKLAFESDRDGDHSFIGIYDPKKPDITYLAPSTNRDGMPRWSPDGKRIAFARIPGKGGKPKPILTQTPTPFSLWVGDVASGTAKRVWQSPDTLLGSYPETAGQVNLHWAAGDRLVFLADLDNWPHLYSIPAAGGTPLLLTPGKFMVEHVAISRDGKFLIYDANTGTTRDDDDRRHLFRVPVDAATPVALTSGTGLRMVAGGGERGRNCLHRWRAQGAALRLADRHRRQGPARSGRGHGAEGIPASRARRAASRQLQGRRWLDHSRTGVRQWRWHEQARPDLRSWRAAAADAAGLALHGLLLATPMR